MQFTEYNVIWQNKYGGQMFESLGVAELIIVLIFIAIPLLLWVIPLIDILKNEFKGNNKIVWILVVLFLPVLGGILYLLIGRGQKILKDI